jgi:phage baseplate assembly protein W
MSHELERTSQIATIKSRAIAYSDIDLKFRVISNSGDIALKKDIQAVKQSVINILMTHRGEKVFHQNFGGSLRDYLFENYDTITAAAIKSRITSTLLNYEPRVQIIDVVITDLIERNALMIMLELNIKSPEETTTTIEFIVERLR